MFIRAGNELGMAPEDQKIKKEKELTANLKEMTY
jgi:hypothetical protein